MCKRYLRRYTNDPTDKFICRLDIGGGGGNSTSTQINYSPEEAAQRAKVMDEAGRIYGQTAPGISSAAYPGPKVIPFSPATDLARQYAFDYAIGPAVSQANNINSAVNFGLRDVLYPSSNPALQDTINAAIRPITESYTDPGGVMSKIRDSAQLSRQYGGSRQGIAEGIAGGRYAREVGDTASKIATEGYSKGLDTFARTLAFAPQALDVGLMPSNILSGVGAQSELKDTELENYLSSARMWGLNAPWAPLQNYASIVFGGASPSTSSSTNTRQSGLQQLSGLASLAMMAGNIFPASDRRLKERIVEVGLHQPTGFKLYEFSYTNQPELRFRGVMADEVKERYPEAVSTDALGFMSVNYGMIGVPFEQVGV